MSGPIEDLPLLSRRALGVGVGLATLAFGATISFGALEFSIGWGERGPEPGYFPFWIGLVICAGSVATIIQAWFDRADAATAVALTRGQAQRALAFFLPMLAFVAVTHWLGLYVATILYLFGVMTWQGGYGVPAAGAVSLGTAVCLYLMFDTWLKVPLAKGPFEAWLRIY
jgi:Tripartite tricarboxylate transporter TctB family